MVPLPVSLSPLPAAALWASAPWSGAATGAAGLALGAERDCSQIKREESKKRPAHICHAAAAASTVTPQLASHSGLEWLPVLLLTHMPSSRLHLYVPSPSQAQPPK